MVELGPDFPAQSIASPAAKVLFSDLKLSAGSHRIQVSLEPADALPQDDRFYAVLEHADPKALLVATDSRADDVAYFGAAVGSLAAPTLNMEQRVPDAIGSSALTSYSLLVIANTGALPDVQARRIKEYVTAGGSVLATLGTNSSLDAGPLLEGWRIGDPEQRSASVGEIATTHPVLRDAATGIPCASSGIARSRSARTTRC